MMQVTLNIEAGQLGNTVVELFQSLDQDQRKEIATEVLTKWLQDPTSVEMAAEDSKALYYARSKSSWSNKDKSAEQLRVTSEYTDYFKEHPTSKQMMIGQIKDEIVKHYQSVVNKVVIEDPKTQDMAKEVGQIVKDTLPKMIHDAMMLWTAANLDKAVNVAITGLMQITKYDNSGGMVSVPAINAMVGSKLQEVMNKVDVKV